MDRDEDQRDQNQQDHRRQQLPPEPPQKPLPSNQPQLPLPKFDPATRIVRRMALYRVIIFGILVYEWNHYLPRDVAIRDGVDSWFTYDQFEFLFHWTPSIASSTMSTSSTSNEAEAATIAAARRQCQWITWAGNSVGIVAMSGGLPMATSSITQRYHKLSFAVAATTTICLYLYRFLTYVHAFTNHNYLFALLAIWTTLSGGGSVTTTTPHRDDIQRCEWCALGIRMQYAIVYFFASLWKLHHDWCRGYIVQGIFLTFEQQGVARGVPWRRLHAAVPHIFVLVALGGLMLDTGMFLALALSRPSPESSRTFTTLSILFHCFVAFTMSQRIGYSFPLCCLAGSVLFAPIGSTLVRKDDDGPYIEVNTVETNLLGWIGRYAVGHPDQARATRAQRSFTLLWLTWQLATPLRMPMVSRGAYPYTAQGYRFSWTMMLHARSTMVAHTGTAVSATDGSDVTKVWPVEFLYLLPECRGQALQRQQYLPDSASPLHDPRTLPLHVMLNVRHWALLNVFPRHIQRVAGGASNVLWRAYPHGCGNERVSVYAVHYAKLNDHGALHRIFDPTVDLAASDAQRAGRSWRQLWTDVFWDQAPGGGRYEYMLEGIGGARSRVTQLETEAAQRWPLDDIKRIEYIVDRAACLAARPLALWPDGFPLAVLALEIPKGFALFLDGRQRSGPATAEQQWDGLSAPQRVRARLFQPQPIVATSIEIGMQVTTAHQKRGLASSKTCRETDTEDVIFALLFMA
jgi:Vitamin K-dependent gamma-carboxylase